MSWAPPVEVNDVEPNLVAVALGRPLFDSGTWRMGWRLFAQTGSIQGDLSCSEADVAAGADPVRNPEGCLEPSNDEVTMDCYGFELSAARRSQGRVEPHFAIAVSELDMEFQVDARFQPPGTGDEFLDRTLLLADDTVVSFAAGLSYKANEKWRLSGELFYTPLGDILRRDIQDPLDFRDDTFFEDTTDLFHVRGMIRYRLR